MSIDGSVRLPQVVIDRVGLKPLDWVHYLTENGRVYLVNEAEFEAWFEGKDDAAP